MTCVLGNFGLFLQPPPPPKKNPELLEFPEVSHPFEDLHTARGSSGMKGAAASL